MRISIFGLFFILPYLLNAQKISLDEIWNDEFVPEQSAIAPWLVTGVADALDDLSRRLGDDDQRMLATRFATVRLDDGKSWCFHPWFGFWPG